MVELSPSPPPARGGIPSSYILAGLIFLAVVLFFATGTLLNGGRDDGAETSVERPLFTVLARDVTSETRAVDVVFSGRTEAAKRVTVRTETPGQVVSVIAEGTRVEKGALLCRLSTDSRRAVVNEARAGFEKAQADFAAAEKLFAEGFASETAVRTARAARDGARARLAQADLDLKNVDVRAPFDGVVGDVMVDPGDVLGAGGPCADLADIDDVIVAGGIGAAQAAQLSIGDAASVDIAGVGPRSGRVGYVADVADDRTRAFRVELTLEDGTGLAAGLNASAVIAAGEQAAAAIPRNALVFNDAGTLGVRTLVDASPSGTAKVGFVPVEIVAEQTQAMFVSGLPDRATVIVRGQDFVTAGTTVAFERVAAADGVSP